MICTYYTLQILPIYIKLSTYALTNYSQPLIKKFLQNEKKIFDYITYYTIKVYTILNKFRSYFRYYKGKEVVQRQKYTTR